MSTSSGIRGIRRKKSSLSEVKIGIIGSPGVGKSALAVRFLTKRYIGTYNNGGIYILYLDTSCMKKYIPI